MGERLQGADSWEQACNPAGHSVGSAYPSALPPLILSPSPFLPHASAQASGTSQRGTGRGTRLVRWLGTYQHLPAAPLPFSSRPHPLKGLMHLPLSCCEMQRLKNSSTGSPGRRGEGGEGASRSRRLSGWPQRPALHLNEEKGLTGSSRACWGQPGRDSSILTVADLPGAENNSGLGKYSVRCWILLVRTGLRIQNLSGPFFHMGNGG